jgi:hypothetical protein
MRIETRPASASISLEARVPSNESFPDASAVNVAKAILEPLGLGGARRPLPTTEVVVSFELLPTDGDDRLDLDTGEVFQNYIRARRRKKEQKLIDARITIRAIPDDSYYQHNVMHYIGERKKGDEFDNPSSIYFEVFIEPTALRELADNIRGGLVPETITIKLINDALNEKAPLQYDRGLGDEKIWHNAEKENQKIPIESVTFHYAVAKPRYDENQVRRLLPMQSSTDRINEQIALIQTILADMSKRLRWTMMGVVALVIMIGMLIAQRMHF